MPYEITFKKSLVVKDDSIYINECCWGGDIIRDELLPVISTRYTKVRTHQEDWGWFIWFRNGEVSLALDIFCDQPGDGLFRIRLTSSRRRFLLRDAIVDAPDLEVLLEVVTAYLQRSAVRFEVERVS